ncbi:TA system VapC family ribonuclease toxin [Terriglobus sp. RCC_193]|uniref:TA system VapC family ribonuclease toxin n=1 Tax=Terriglobus sp. RCC_193 TaxID=3239218 RepID=UPI00352322CD
MALAILDANLLIYAFNPSDKIHLAALRWLEDMLSGEDVVAIPMLAISALLRVSTHPSLERVPERMKDAERFIDELTALPNVRTLHTDQEHWRHLKLVLRESGVSGARVTDAQFAALALQHDGTLYSTDNDFHRFPRLRWTNPLR